jgi:hypothetical protein
MAYFSNADLQYKDYVWHSRQNHDDPTKTHFPDNVLLATREGYEMVSFINAIARQNNWNGNKGGGYKIERLIRQYLPAHIRGRQDVLAWLSSNWSVYQ